MKKMCISLAARIMAIVMLAGLLPCEVSAAQNPRVVLSESVLETNEDSAVSFPDPNFEAAVREAVGKPAGDIFKSDVEAVSSLIADNRDIKSLAGIEYFINLQVLDCSSNQLTEFNVSNNTALTDLYCHDNYIPSEANIIGLNKSVTTNFDFYPQNIPPATPAPDNGFGKILLQATFQQGKGGDSYDLEKLDGTGTVTVATYGSGGNLGFDNTMPIILPTDINELDTPLYFMGNANNRYAPNQLASGYYIQPEGMTDGCIELSSTGGRVVLPKITGPFRLEISLTNANNSGTVRYIRQHDGATEEDAIASTTIVNEWSAKREPSPDGGLTPPGGCEGQWGIVNDYAGLAADAETYITLTAGEGAMRIHDIIVRAAGEASGETPPPVTPIPDDGFGEIALKATFSQHNGDGSAELPMLDGTGTVWVMHGMSFQETAPLILPTDVNKFATPMYIMGQASNRYYPLQSVSNYYIRPEGMTDGCIHLAADTGRIVLPKIVGPFTLEVSLTNAANTGQVRSVRQFDGAAQDGVIYFGAVPVNEWEAKRVPPTTSPEELPVPALDCEGQWGIADYTHLAADAETYIALGSNVGPMRIHDIIVRVTEEQPKEPGEPVSPWFPTEMPTPVPATPAPGLNEPSWYAKNISSPWMTSVYGDIGINGNVTEESLTYGDKLTNGNVLLVEETGEDSVHMVMKSDETYVGGFGKISSVSDGFLYYFHQLNLTDSFSLRANADAVLDIEKSYPRQQSFGIMLRDYIEKDIGYSTAEKSRLNQLTSGLVNNSQTLGSDVSRAFMRVGGYLNTGSRPGFENFFYDGYNTSVNQHNVKIGMRKVGNYVELKYGGQPEIIIDLNDADPNAPGTKLLINDEIYVGFMVSRNADATYSDIEFLKEEREIEDVRIVKLPDKTKFSQGEAFDGAGMVVEVKYNGYSGYEILPEDLYLVTGLDSDIPGLKTLHVNAGYKYATLEAEVIADEPATPPPATEPPVTEPPATEPPATEPPVTEPPATEPPVDSYDAVITVGSQTVKAGDEIDVAVSVKENTGMAMFKFELNFDKTKLTPISITKGEALPSGTLTSNVQQEGVDLSTFDFVTASWTNPQNISEDGVLFTVKFKVAADAAGDTGLNITVVDALDENSKKGNVGIESGNINFVEFIMGDVFTDGVVSGADLLKLTRYLAGWPEKMTAMELEAADVFADGDVTAKDLLKLSQYYAGWQGIILGE